MRCARLTSSSCGISGYLLISRRYWSSEPSSNDGPRLPEPTCIGRMRLDLVLNWGVTRTSEAWGTIREKWPWTNLTLRWGRAQPVASHESESPGQSRHNGASYSHEGV